MEPVLLGVLGDTHGRADACRAALDLLRERGAAGFAHTGDVGGEAVLDALAGTGCRLVWGNTDADRPEAYARDLGLDPLGDWGRFGVAGRSVVLTHGDDAAGLRRLLADLESGRDRVDLLLTGHTHVPHDRPLPGGGRWVNPGALHRARPRTCCLVTLGEAVGVELVEVPRSGEPGRRA